MMRLGASVKRPAITSAPQKRPTMVERWRRTEWWWACQMPSGSITSVKIDSKWMGLHSPQRWIS